MVKFQQATIGGGKFGSLPGKNHDFNLLVAFEQFLGEDLRQAGKSGGRAGSSKKISKTVGTDGNERQSSETQPEVKKNRRERGESEGREFSAESLSRMEVRMRANQKTKRSRGQTQKKRC